MGEYNRVTKIDLGRLFGGLQKQLEAKLKISREGVQHPGAKGQASEFNWVAMLSDYLPSRYQVSSAFVLDCEGTLSEQIDIVIHDRQYSTLLFNEAGVRYIPAESVYAVLEVKQQVDKGLFEYASGKAASVRKLKRTSTVIPHAGGVYKPRELFPILAGIVCLGSGWKMDGAAIKKAVASSKPDERLDLGCALEAGAFEARYGEEIALDVSSPESALIFFYTRLLQRLQALGTVPAIDLGRYTAPIK